MAELAFVVRFRGAKHALSLDASAPARELFAAVERATGVPAAGQKLIARGKKLALGEVGEAAVVGELVRNGDALMLSGATAVDAADLAAQQEAGRRNRVRGFADEARVQRRRLGLEVRRLRALALSYASAHAHTDAHTLTRARTLARHTQAGDPNQVRAYSTARAGKGAATLSDLGSMGSPFGAVRELAAGAVHAAALAFRNGLVDGDGLDAAAAAARAAREAPPPSAARALLERVAADAGVVGIMRERGWRVGALTEMPPVGKVCAGGRMRAHARVHVCGRVRVRERVRARAPPCLALGRWL